MRSHDPSIWAKVFLIYRLNTKKRSINILTDDSLSNEEKNDEIIKVHEQFLLDSIVKLDPSKQLLYDFSKAKNEYDDWFYKFDKLKMTDPDTLENMLLAKDKMDQLDAQLGELLLKCNIDITELVHTMAQDIIQVKPDYNWIYFLNLYPNFYNFVNTGTANDLKSRAVGGHLGLEGDHNFSIWSRQWPDYENGGNPIKKIIWEIICLDI